MGGGEAPSGFPRPAILPGFDEDAYANQLTEEDEADGRTKVEDAGPKRR